MMELYGILLMIMAVVGFFTAPAAGFAAGFCYGTTFSLGFTLLIGKIEWLLR